MKETDARGLEWGEKPDGALSGLLWEYERRAAAANAHAAFEGYERDSRPALRGYDRALHPWIHGRRPEDLVERVRSWLQ